MPTFASRTASLLAASLVLACQQGEPPSAVETKGSEPSPAPAATPAGDGRIAVTITYCVP